MLLRRLIPPLGALLLALGLLASPALRPALATQDSCVEPVVGPKTEAQLQALLNTCLQAVLSNYSGSVPPSVPLQYQWWMDTSTTPKTLRLYDGASWVAVGTLDIAAHIFQSSAPVTSVSNSDGTLTIFPTTGAVIASLALGHSNVWTAVQQFANIGINTAPGSQSLRIQGSAGNFSEVIIGSSTIGQSLGQNIQAGTNSSDFAFQIANQSASAFLLNIFGDGGMLLGNSNVSPGAKNFAINQNTVPLVSGGLAPRQFSIQGADNTQPGMTIDAFMAGVAANQAPFIMVRTNGGTAAAPAAMPTGFEIGVYTASAHDGTAYSTGETGSLVFSSCEPPTWSVGKHCTNAKIDVTLIGSTTLIQGLLLDPSVNGKLLATLGQAGAVTTTLQLSGKTSGQAAIAAQDIAGAFVLTLDGASVNSILKFGGNLTIANSFTTSGNFGLTLTATAATNATLPAGTHALAQTDSPTLSGTIGGNLNWSGTQQFNGNVGVGVAPSTAALTLQGAAGLAYLKMVGSSTVGQSDGAFIQSGTNASDYALQVVNQASSNFLFVILGDGSNIIGAPTGGGKGLGTLNVASLYYANGTAGVSCSGSPTASFAATNGITTHC